MNPTLNVLKCRGSAELQKIYARIPKIECRRMCQIACGHIDAAPIEQLRVKQATGETFGMVRIVGSRPTCTFLTDEGDCRVYALRPLKCRLFGVIPDLECPHGCKPERWLDHFEVQQLIREIDAIFVRLPGE